MYEVQEGNISTIANYRVRLPSNNTPAKTQQTSFSTSNRNPHTAGTASTSCEDRVEQSGYVYVRARRNFTWSTLAANKIMSQSANSSAQMLPVPGSKLKYFGGKILEVLRVLAVFRAFILRVLRVLRVFWAGVLADTSILAVFRSSILVDTPCT